MRTEAQKAFRNGFFLTEQEYRRMYDSVSQQMDKVAGKDNYSSIFEMKFRNGSIGETTSIDEILSQENSGTASVQKLKMTLVENKDTHPHTISIAFANIDAEFDLSLMPSIEYFVRSNDRDWVFITSSLIDERISRIKRFAPNQLATRKGLLAIFLILMFFVSILLLVMSPAAKKDILALNALDVISDKWKAGEIQDPVEALIAIETAKATSSVKFFEILYKPIVFVPFTLMFFVLIGAVVWWFYFPVYNFYWGDYMKTFDKKQNIGKFIFVGIFVAIVISVFSNYISAILGIGR